MSRLILHADDLGMNRAVNAGIFRGFRYGLLTSTSLMTNAPDVAWALSRWKTLLVEHEAGRIPSYAARSRLNDPELPFDLGVHLNLTQGQPLTADHYPAELLDRNGQFPGVFALMRKVRRHGVRYREAIRGELEQQIRMLLDHGLQPTHLNGHQYIEMMPVVREIVLELLEKYVICAVRVAREPGLLRTARHPRIQLAGWPLALVKQWFARRFLRLIKARTKSGKRCFPDAYFGTAHAGQIDIGLLKSFLSRARGCAAVEVGLHPGEATGVATQRPSGAWLDPLEDQRPRELAMLLSPELAEWLFANGWQLGRLAGLR